MIPPDRLRQPDPQPKASRFRKGKLAGTLIAAGSAAIVSVYTIGYVQTEASDPFAVAAAAPAVTATQAAPTATATAIPSVVQRSGQRGQQAAATATPTQSSSTTAAGFADGSYTGTGTSRHGGMSVTVVISGGKITSAAVASCNTRYPCSDINPLIQAVVSQQTVPVNHVSGATDSSNAYKQAVSSALGQARAAATAQ